MKKLKTLFSKNDKLIKIIFVAILFCLSYFLILKSISLNVESNVKCNQTSDIDYFVNLKENDFYTERRLAKGKQYIAALIESIETNFNYKFMVNEKLDYKYNYETTATINITDDSTHNNIYTKKEVLFKSNDIELKNSNGFDLNKKINVDYNKYNDIVKKFKNQYAISCNSNLLIEMKVYVKDETGNELKSINANNNMTLTIPLTEQMINIKMDSKNVNNSNTIKAHANLKIENKILFSIAVVLVLVAIVIIITLLIGYLKNRKKKTLYEKTLDKILREFDRVIVEADKINIDEDLSIIDVKTFQEILDARDNLEKPIVFNEVYRGHRSIFIVKNEYEAYRYILDENDLENEN